MKTVLLLLSTDRFSFPLLRYMAEEAKKHSWKITVGSMFDVNVTDRLKKEEKFKTSFTFLNITHFKQCEQAIRKADLVISLLPDAMLLKVADSCVLYGKALITPSRLNRQMVLRRSQAEENDTLLLMECGFSPGLDHITAKKAIDNIHSKGGKIVSFKTYSGSLIDENCIDNPWQFKLTEPAAEIINTGKNNNRHLIHGKLQHIPYHQLFSRGEPVFIQGLEGAIVIPEGDSLYYRKIYQLTEADTVLKGKLLRAGFDRTWNLLIRLGLTDSASRIDFSDENSFYHFLDSFLPYSCNESSEFRLNKYMGTNTEDIEKMKWLGLFSDEWISGYKELTPALVLQHLMERKFTMQPEDKDCIVMQHQLEYTYRNARHKFTATLIDRGENKHESATARAIGYTTGAAAKSYLLGRINLKGLHIPTKKEIYDPVLNELDELNVAFHVEEKTIYDTEVTVNN